MSLQQYYQFEYQQPLFDLSAGSIKDFNFFNIHSSRQGDEFDNAKLPRKRRDDTNDVVNRLYEQTLSGRPGERDVLRTGGRKNKNEILGLANARLIKEKHLFGDKYFRDLDLVRGIQANVNNGEFVLVLRTDGRIVAMSDEVEHHLGKTMRSLYTQCINMFECLNSKDGQKLQSILNFSADLTNKEHRLVCTFRLPKGKRPSRIREDVKAISMAGHFYSCHNSCYERLFVARCEALVSRTTNGTSSSQTNMLNNTTIKITLNDDMTVSMISSNVKDVLGYSRNDLIGNWFGRILATNDLENFESIRQAYFQHDQQMPINIFDIFDVYTSNGENRLTFLCQIRPTRERRSKAVKYSIIGQLIDPSMRDEYVEYVHGKSESDPVSIKVEQVNLVSPKASEDTIMANSPSLAMGLLMFDNVDHNTCQQRSPSFTRSLSNVVAPFIFNDESAQFFDIDYCPNTTFDDTFMKLQLEQELASIDALIDEY